MSHMYRNKKGFSLVEIMVVMLIIGIIASIAISSALSARVNGNEVSTKHSLKTLQTASVQYRGIVGQYPTDLAALGDTYLGNGLETGYHNGYNYELVNANSGQTFTVTATPQTPNFTGVRSYCTDVYATIFQYNAPTISADGMTCPAGGTALQT